MGWGGIMRRGWRWRDCEGRKEKGEGRRGHSPLPLSPFSFLLSLFSFLFSLFSFLPSPFSVYFTLTFKILPPVPTIHPTLGLANATAQ